MAFSPETYALLKAQGGGGGGSFPTPSASNVGQALTVQKKAVPGAIIVPEQTVTISSGIGGSLENVNNDLVAEGVNCIVYINNVEYQATIDSDWYLIFSSYTIDFNQDYINTDDGTYTVSVYAADYAYEYGLDPYNGADCVLELDAPNLEGAISASVIRGDIAAIEAKALAGNPIKVFAYGKSYDDPDYPYTTTFGVVSAWWNNYDYSHDNHSLEITLENHNSAFSYISFLDIRFYSTGSISFVNKYKVNLTNF